MLACDCDRFQLDSFMELVVTGIKAWVLSCQAYAASIKRIDAEM